ncbi:type IV pilus biogenesis protein PilM [Verrucomicrobiota bacterium]
MSDGPGQTGFINHIKHACKCATQEQLAAIDLSDGRIFAAFVTRDNTGKTKLQRAGWSTYSFNDSDETVARKIRQLWKECEIPTHLVTTCLHTRSLSIKHFKYTGLSMPEIESALRLEAEESMQLPANEIILDWHLNDPQGTPDNPTTSGILASAPSRKAKRLINKLRKAGLYPAIIDTGPTAVSNLYLQLKGKLPAGESLAIVNLSDFHADICILYEEKNLYPRSIFSQSERWNKNIDYLLESLQDALLYYHIKISKDPIKKILVTGSIPEDPGFIAQLSESTGLPAECWNPLDEPDLHIAKACDRDTLIHTNQSLMTTCLGIALRREAEYDYL